MLTHRLVERCNVGRQNSPESYASFVRCVSYGVLWRGRMAPNPAEFVCEWYASTYNNIPCRCVFRVTNLRHGICARRATATRLDDSNLTHSHATTLRRYEAIGRIMILNSTHWNAQVCKIISSMWLRVFEFACAHCLFHIGTKFRYVSRFVIPLQSIPKWDKTLRRQTSYPHGTTRLVFLRVCVRGGH